jgi:DNA end-binding protein Ku
VPQREGRARRRARLGVADEESAAPGPRPIWSGSLSFGLVTVPVELFSAQRGSGVPMRMLSADGTPLVREYVCPKEEKPLGREEIVRGYALGDDEFLVVTDEELAALAPRRSRDIELQRFVPRGEIDPAYFIRTYYLVPTGEQTKAYRLLAEIMEQQDRAGIARFVMRERAYAIAIFADAGILRGATLRFADELRTPEAIGLPEPGKVDATRVRAIGKAISALAARELSEDELRDDGSARLLALAREKRRRGEGVVEVPEEAQADAADGDGGEVVDLMELLKQRLGVQGPLPKRSRPKRAPAGKKTAASAAKRRAQRADGRTNGKTRGRRAASRRA